MFRSWLAFIAPLLLLLAGPAPALALGDAPPKAGKQEIAAAELSAEARSTIALIRKGGPFPFDRDGAVFGNFEKRLPIKERGYYREYTVRTPGVKSRGARRIVAGRDGELYYSDDHYDSFRRVKEP